MRTEHKHFILFLCFAWWIDKLPKLPHISDYSVKYILCSQTHSHIFNVTCLRIIASYLGITYYKRYI